MALQELIYTSLAVPSRSDEHVEGILKASHANNKKYGITGLLLFDNDRYIQVLEGEPENLDVLYAAISKDVRHHSLELLHRGGISGRSFQDWRMAFEAIPKGLLDDLAENMAVYSFEIEDDILDADESFGARLHGMFMDAIAAE